MTQILSIIIYDEETAVEPIGCRLSYMSFRHRMWWLRPLFLEGVIRSWLFSHLDFIGLIGGERRDVHCSTIVPTIPPIAPTIQYTSPFICTDLFDNDTSERLPSQDPYEVIVARWRSRVATRSSPPIHDSSRDSLSETSSDSHSDTSSDSSSRHSSSGYAKSDSPCDSSAAIFAGPSRKRCRSLTTSVPAASPVPGALSPVRADLLPPRKRIRYSNSETDLEVSLEEGFVPHVPREIGLGVDVEDSYKPYTELDIDLDVQADIDACIAFADDIASRWTDVRVKIRTAAEEEAKSSARGTIEIGVDRLTHPVVSDDTAEAVRENFPELVSADESLEVMQRGLDMVMQELYDHMVEIPVHRVRVIESVQRDQGHRIMATSQQSAAMSVRIGTLERDNRRLRGMLDVERQRVDRLWHSMSYVQRDLWQICRFRFYDRVRIMTITSSGMIPAAIEELISQRVEEELAAQEANCNVGLIDENQSQNGDDNDNGSGGNGNQGNNNGDGNQNGKMENDKIKRFIWGLPDNIQGNVTSSKPVRLQDAIRMAIGLMDQKVYMYAGRNVEQKRKFNNNPRGNRVQQPPFKRQNVAKVVTVGKNERRGYARSAPYCKKCILHHEGPCTIKCTRCKKGHYKSDCPKLKNQNRGNNATNNDSRRKAYGLGGGDGNPDSNVVTGTFLLNNHYAYILFYSATDRSFVSTMFSALIDIPPTALDVRCTVELADGRIAESNIIIRGYTLNLLDHLFSTDLLPVELGSFDVVIGMDWLSKYHDVIVYDEKIVCIPYGNEILTIRGDGSSKGSNSRLDKLKAYLLIDLLIRLISDL
ncbi:reverse transcriptase domain-containing protein [Tanacetum coccineum]